MNKLIDHLTNAKRSQSRVPRFFLGPSCFSYDVALTLRLLGDNETTLAIKDMIAGVAGADYVYDATFSVGGEAQNKISYKPVSIFDTIASKRTHIVLKGGGALVWADGSTVEWANVNDTVCYSLPTTQACVMNLVKLNVHLVVTTGDKNKYQYPWELFKASNS